MRAPSVRPAGAFLSCDWGTSQLRLRMVRVPALTILGEITTNQGIASTHALLPTGKRGRTARARCFFDVLTPLVKRLARRCGVAASDLPLVVSGMASSSLGIQELPYARLPMALDGSGVHAVRLPVRGTDGRAVLLISGVRAECDVMRGEETQVIGIAATMRPTRTRRVVVLPGTHSKHVTVEGKRVVGFTTYMTGEFFALLAQHSILARSVAREPGCSSAGTRARFAEGVRIGAQENLLHASFGVRARTLLGRMSGDDAREYLSGLLLGAELADLARSDVPAVDLVCAAPLDRAYARALRILGFSGTIRRHDAARAVVTGHYQLARVHGLWGDSGKRPGT